ncbi:collagen alpha-1(II) chain-like [Physella acuta]|uniref:collagen alpha-1(II) chain-like n=1 Tax=Physella acuta TaxID=109671 RepID=UPI0027DB840E|nr:collagen alpha-1(II) chain-like [Physella acuta]
MKICFALSALLCVVIFELTNGQEAKPIIRTSNCENNGVEYKAGEVYYPDPCELCKCVVEKSSICYKIKCNDTIVCPDNKEAYLPEGECCKKCPISIHPGDVVEGAQLAANADAGAAVADDAAANAAVGPTDDSAANAAAGVADTAGLNAAVASDDLASGIAVQPMQRPGDEESAQSASRTERAAPTVEGADNRSQNMTVQVNM